MGKARYSIGTVSRIQSFWGALSLGKPTEGREAVLRVCGGEGWPKGGYMWCRVRPEMELQAYMSTDTGRIPPARKARCESWGSYVCKGLRATRGKKVKNLSLGQWATPSWGQDPSSRSQYEPLQCGHDSGEDGAPGAPTDCLLASVLPYLYLYADYWKLWRQTQDEKSMLMSVSNHSFTPPRNHNSVCLRRGQGVCNFKPSTLPTPRSLDYMW